MANPTSPEAQAGRKPKLIEQVRQAMAGGASRCLMRSTGNTPTPLLMALVRRGRLGHKDVKTMMILRLRSGPYGRGTVRAAARLVMIHAGLDVTHPQLPNQLDHPLHDGFDEPPALLGDDEVAATVAPAPVPAPAAAPSRPAATRTGAMV